MNLSAKKILLVGAFDFINYDTGGQPVKSREIYKQLIKIFGQENVNYLETIGWKRHPLKLIRNFTILAKDCDDIIMMPAQRGVIIFSIMLCKAKKFYMSHIHYIVIGGWLPNYVKNRKRLSNRLKKFDEIYVETKTMREALRKQNFCNVNVMPNFKNIRILDKSELVYYSKEPYHFCTFSRVMKEKGIADAISAVLLVNQHYGRTICTLDIFGQINLSQKNWFEALMKEAPDFIRYKGIADCMSTSDLLKKYYALLFPTYYEGEGYAGTLIDAMAAGVPVIASDWKYNREIVDNGKTGMIFNTHDVNELANKMIWTIDHHKEWNRMKFFCINKARDNTPENVIKILLSKILNHG